MGTGALSAMTKLARGRMHVFTMHVINIKLIHSTNNSQSALAVHILVGVEDATLVAGVCSSGLHSDRSSAHLPRLLGLQKRMDRMYPSCTL